jgi:hypothetical protein
MSNYFKPLFAFMTVALTGIAQAQTVKTPAASPLQTIKQAFSLSDITVEYSRPSVKGRVIYGDLVPSHKIWRTGANASTKITFGEDVKVEGTRVAAGTYAVYTIPGKSNWEFMLYKDLKLGGNTDDYKKENEVLRFSVKSEAMAEKVETFTINIADMTASSTNIELSWEKTRVAFKVTADFDSTVMANIDKAMNNDNRPYYQAARYYYDNGKDLNKALEWINKAIEMNPKAFFMMNLKANIQLKMKDYKGAIATAENVIALAKPGADDEYIETAKKIISDAKKEQ